MADMPLGEATLHYDGRALRFEITVDSAQAEALRRAGLLHVEVAA